MTAIPHLVRCGSSVLWLLTLATPPLPAQTPAAPFNDHQNMLDQLGVKILRRGADPNRQDTFNEAMANPYANSRPDVLTMRDGTIVPTSIQPENNRLTSGIIGDPGRPVAAAKRRRAGVPAQGHPADDRHEQQRPQFTAGDREGSRHLQIKL